MWLYMEKGYLKAETANGLCALSFEKEMQWTLVRCFKTAGGSSPREYHVIVWCGGCNGSWSARGLSRCCARRKSRYGVRSSVCSTAIAEWLDMEE